MGDSVGDTNPRLVGCDDGIHDGCVDGCRLGCDDGIPDGWFDGCRLGCDDGIHDGHDVGQFDGCIVLLLKAVYLAHYLAVTMEYCLVEDLVAMMAVSMDCLMADYLVPE